MQPGEEEDQGTTSVSINKYLKGGCREDRARHRGDQCQDNRQWAQTEVQEVHSIHQEKKKCVKKNVVSLHLLALYEQMLNVK